MNNKKRIEIHERLRGKPFLLPMETGVYSIPERIEEIEPALFVAFNSAKQQYEVHSLNNLGSTLCFAVPYEELDARVLYMFRKSNVRTRGIKAILREIDGYNENLEKSNERYRRGEINAMAKEIRPAFKRLAEEVY